MGLINSPTVKGQGACSKLSSYSHSYLISQLNFVVPVASHPVQPPLPSLSGPKEGHVPDVAFQTLSEDVKSVFVYILVSCRILNYLPSRYYNNAEDTGSCR